MVNKNPNYWPEIKQVGYLQVLLKMIAFDDHFITVNSLSLFSWSCVVIMRRKFISATLCNFDWSRISSVSIAQAGGRGLNSQAGPILKVLK